jgi:hypothetical protein
MGIGCACDPTHGYTCYVVSAKSIIERINYERLPLWQDFTTTCSSYCPYLSLDSSTKFTDPVAT